MNIDCGLLDIEETFAEDDPYTLKLDYEYDPEDKKFWWALYKVKGGEFTDYKVNGGEFTDITRHLGDRDVRVINWILEQEHELYSSYDGE